MENRIIVLFSSNYIQSQISSSVKSRLSKLNKLDKVKFYNYEKTNIRKLLNSLCILPEYVFVYEKCGGLYSELVGEFGDRITFLKYNKIKSKCNIESNKWENKKDFSLVEIILSILNNNKEKKKYYTLDGNCENFVYDLKEHEFNIYEFYDFISSCKYYFPTIFTNKIDSINYVKEHLYGYKKLYNEKLNEAIKNLTNSKNKLIEIDKEILKYHNIENGD